MIVCVINYNRSWDDNYQSRVYSIRLLVDVDFKIEKEIGRTKDNVGKFYLNNSSVDGTQSVLLFTRDIIAQFR